MLDEDFKEFLDGEGFAPAIECRPVDDETLAYYQGKLPNRLLGYWREFGFCGYGEGLFWTVNPRDYAELLESWLQKTPLWGRENFYVIARTAFGKLHVWGDKSHDDTIIDPHYNTVLPADLPEKEITPEQIERHMGIFFNVKNKKSTDYYDKDDKLLFKKALKKLGHLEPDEMYTFSPALAAGGAADIKNVTKAKIHEQLAILSELDTPQMLKSVKEVFGPL
jgi:hypothetical protein